MEIENKARPEMFNQKRHPSEFKKGLEFFKQKKVQNSLIIIVLLLTIILGTYIRVQNLDSLKDQTTGEYIPLALDPYYFLRIAETKLEMGGLPEFDSMRFPAIQKKWHPEILPDVVIGIYKIGDIFSDISLQKADVLYPVIFFILGLIAFFFMARELTKSKWIALISSIILAFIPSYLYRTMAGFADHEAIGMFAFFIAIFVFAFSLKKIKKNPLIWGILSGLASVFVIVSWGGIAKFLFMIFPLTIFLIWFTNKEKKNILFFYFSWIVSSVLIGGLTKYGFSEILNRFLMNTQGLIGLFVFGFITVDYILINNKKIFEKLRIKEKYRTIWTLGITIVLGLIVLLIFKSEFLGDLINKLLHPFGQGRVGLTVAENRQPYLNNWIGNIGRYLFWLFFGGLIFWGIKNSKKLGKNKAKTNIIWIVFVCGIVFSRISNSSMLNGENFISRLFYFGAIILFFGYLIQQYFKNELKIKKEDALLFSFIFFMLIAARGAVRLFFVITPLVSLMGGYFVIGSFKLLKNKNKDEMIKMFKWVLVILACFGLIMGVITSYNVSLNQSQNTGPSANYQWQNSMSWVKNNTSEDSIFLHWWDYGYWVQTLGGRPTIADGGFHPEYLVHNIGRYILTTPKPESAFSFMKSNNVSYLLIDQTDLGKYGAYSKIGSNGTNSNWDRFSNLPIGNLDKSQIQETSNMTMRVYPLGAGVDKDIVYKKDNETIFIPGPTYDEIGTPNYMSVVVGVIIKTTEKNGTKEILQPEVAYYYNERQYRLPLRYVYFQGKIYDFEKGVDAIVRVVPSVSQSNEKIGIDKMGSVIYLSPMVSKSLFARLYLMDDPFNQYETLKLAHSEDDMIVSMLKDQGAISEDFVIYGGFRGPIKIWSVDYPENIKVVPEMTRTKSDNWAGFDDYDFVKA